MDVLKKILNKFTVLILLAVVVIYFAVLSARFYDHQQWNEFVKADCCAGNFIYRICYGYDCRRLGPFY